MLLELIPAYGKVYNTTNAMVSDWNDGKDFKIRGGGPYCSIRNIDALKERGYTCVRIYPNMLHEYFETKLI